MDYNMDGKKIEGQICGYKPYQGPRRLQAVGRRAADPDQRTAVMAEEREHGERVLYRRRLGGHKPRIYQS